MDQTTHADETTPLFVRTRKRPGTVCTRFMSYVALGLFLFLGWTLVFLPRTSIARDLRRIHFSRAPLSELKLQYVHSVSNDSLAKTLSRYTQEPHLAGENYGLVEWTASQFADAGFQTDTDAYHVWFNHPGDCSLRLLRKSDHSLVYEPTLVEDVISEDPTTGSKNSIPVFHGYSASGNVSGQYIYGHYCRREDFLKLEAHNVEIKGKIVLCRYGFNYRGVKVQGAEQRGAVGVVIYSDPGDDGNVTIQNGFDAYPDGPARNPSSVQRGSVMFLADIPGDPTTPGWPSTKNAKRVEPVNVPHIPSLPISYKEALPILKSLNGHGVSGSSLGWTGGLEDFDYSVGPAPKLELNLVNDQDYDIRPIWNVVGTLPGIIGDEAIVVGNHRDAWVVGGAGDPNAGSAALIELAHALGEMVKKGWRPLRTIILASWDGEELGLLGSTEWGEDKELFLKQRVLAYINLDMVVTAPGGFSAAASPLLYQVMRQSAKEVLFNGSSLYESWKTDVNASIDDLGSGSDYTVFQHHLGVPSLDFGFNGAKGENNPVYHYHSNYDSYHWMEEFGDPGFHTLESASKYLGVLLLNMVETSVASLHASDYATKILHELGKLDTNSVNKKCAWAMKHLHESANSFAESARAFDNETARLLSAVSEELPWYLSYRKLFVLAEIKMQNMRIKEIERIFLHDEGLHDRPWFKSIMFAPNRWNGYTPTALPALVEAIEDKDYKLLLGWITIYSEKLRAAAELLTSGRLKK